MVCGPERGRNHLGPDLQHPVELQGADGRLPGHAAGPGIRQEKSTGLPGMEEAGTGGMKRCRGKSLARK